MGRYFYFYRLTAFNKIFSILCLYLFFINISLADNVQPKVDTKALHVGFTLEPESLDPTTHAATITQRITYQNIFEGLTQINQQGEVIPCLAKSWKLSDDGLTYTFLLQPRIYFHNGVLLTPDIVKYSLLRLSDQAGNNPIKEKFQHIEKVERLESNQLTVQLKWVDNYFLFNLGLGNAVIQEPSNQKHNTTHPIGTGPYTFEKWKKGSSLTLRANSNYWQAQPPIKQVDITFSPTHSEVVKLLAESSIDGYNNISEINFLDTLATKTRYKQVVGKTQGEIIIAFNHKNPMLASLTIRQAISYAIDRQKIKSTLYLDSSELISSFFPAHQAASLALGIGYPFDLAKAKSLMKDNNIKIKPLRLLVPPPAYARFSSVHISQMLEEINIPLVVELVTWKQWMQSVYIEKDYDLTVIAHSEANDLDIYTKDNYYFNYNNPEYKQVVAQLMKSKNKAQLIQLQLKAQWLLIKDAASVFLFMLPKIGIWDSRLQGYWVDEPLPALVFSEMFWRDDANQ